MSASVSLIPTTTSNSLSSPAAPQTLTSGLSILGSGAGLFGHILSLGNTELLATDAPQSPFQLTGTAVGNNGVGLDSSMLTLSQELSSLSAEDLQALIDKAMLSDGKGEGIDIETLKSLTKGIPSLDGVANENVDSNSLLSATNITPATLSDLKSLLNAIKNTSGTELDINALKEVEDKSDIDLSSATSNELIMVVFVPAQIENRNSDITDFEFDPSIFSSLTKSVQPKASEPSLFDNGIDLYSGTESSLSFSGEDGEKLDFQGSLSSLGGKKAKDESNSLNVNGQLSMSTADKAMSFFTTPLSHFADRHFYQLRQTQLASIIYQQIQTLFLHLRQLLGLIQPPYLLQKLLKRHRVQIRPSKNSVYSLTLLNWAVCRFTSAWKKVKQ
jgi:hypothetical protein